MLLALLIGSGFHAICMAALTVLLSLIWGTNNVAGLFIVSFPYFSYLNGYVAAKFYVFFNGASWKNLAILSTIFYPVLLFSGYFLLDYIDPVFAKKLIGESLSFETLAYLTVFINVPGAALGAYQGLLSTKLEAPTKQSRLNRDIPDFNLKSRRCRTLCAAILPFIAIYL